MWVNVESKSKENDIHIDNDEIDEYLKKKNKKQS